MQDNVDVILEQWRQTRPDLDCSPMGILGRISRASRLLERSIRDYHVGHGLEPWEFDVLATLRRAGAPYQLSAGQLGRSAMVSPGGLTNRADRLVAKGLVERDLDPASRRRMLIKLTARGREIVDSVLPGHVDNERRLLAALNEGDQADLQRILRTLLISLDDQAPIGDGDTGGRST